MKSSDQDRAERGNPGTSKAALLWLLGFSVVILVVGICLPRPRNRSEAAAPRAAAVDPLRFDHPPPIPSPRHSELAAAAAAKTPEEIVAAKLARFARSRRQLAYALARRYHVQVPDDVNRFFVAVESGNWDESQACFKALNGGDASASQGGGRPPGVNDLWSAIIDAYGVAEQVHLWPAQALLDYGNGILDSLRPGMVYVGGTDNGRWIPELLNDTSDGEQHIVVTQNGLADAKYLDYLDQLYGGRLSTLTPDDAQHAFQAYVADAQQRLQHDQQFPDEPKQVLPGENISSSGGKIQVSGQVAVMQINERLLQTLMQKNPDLSFGIEESFPLKGTYADAVPLGPLMQLGVPDAPAAFTPDVAAQTLDYWQNTAQDILADPQAAASESALRSYSHDINAAANLLAAHNYTDQAEQTYRLATQLWPGNPEPIDGLAGILARTGRANEARQLLDNFARTYPQQQSALPSVWSATTGQ